MTEDIPCALCVDASASMWYDATDVLLNLLRKRPQLDITGHEVGVPLCERCHGNISETVDIYNTTRDPNREQIASNRLEWYARTLDAGIIRDASE